MYIAQAREAVEMRAQLEKKMAQKRKEEKEENLRALAQKAREERAGIRRGDGNTQSNTQYNEITHNFGIDLYIRVESYNAAIQTLNKKSRIYGTSDLSK